MLTHDPQSLRIFLSACEARSMSRAAEELNIALSAVSRRLRILEEQVGAPLFMRRPHGIEPTAAGVTMMNYARDILRLGNKLKVSLDEHRDGVRGYVRVCASSSVLVQRLAKDLSRFVKENPQIKLDLEERPTASTINAVLGKQADIGLIVYDSDVHGLKMRRYAGDRLAIAVPARHAFAKRRHVKFAELMDEDVVALESGTATHRLLSLRAAEVGRPMKMRVQVRSFEVMCLMISKGLGIGILPELAARPLAQALNLRVVPLAEPWAAREHAICVRASETIDAPNQRLIAFLSAEAGREGQRNNRP